MRAAGAELALERVDLDVEISPGAAVEAGQLDHGTPVVLGVAGDPDPGATRADEQRAEQPEQREDRRLERAERWLPAHPDSPALSLCLGRLRLRAQGLGHAEEWLHRAIAQGAGAEAWEDLGQLYTAQDNPAQAQACYANALRVLRGEPARPLGGRSLREQIADEAVIEQRDEHGLPRLRP